MSLIVVTLNCLFLTRSMDLNDSLFRQFQKLVRSNEEEGQVDVRLANAIDYTRKSSTQKKCK